MAVEIYKLMFIPNERQTENMSCWFYAAKMVLRTFNGDNASVKLASSQNYQDRMKSGLDNSHFSTFANDQGFTDLASVESGIFRLARRQSSAGLNFQNLVDLFNNYGPLWTSVRGAAGQHVLVLTAVSKDTVTEIVTVRYNDPGTGKSATIPLGSKADEIPYGLNDMIDFPQSGCMLAYKPQNNRRAPMPGIFSLQKGVAANPPCSIE